jgi:D-hexose-6-phosphate mutarotase
MAITSNLYPPIVQDTIPAFIRTKPCRIYFALSTYNTISDIKNVQVSLINQKTNASALKTEMYPSGIKITNMFYDSDAKGEYNYYIQIEPSDLQNRSFDLN